jgi:hypothetical protein
VNLLNPVSLLDPVNLLNPVSLLDPEDQQPWKQDRLDQLES